MKNKKNIMYYILFFSIFFASLQLQAEEGTIGYYQDQSPEKMRYQNLLPPYEHTIIRQGVIGYENEESILLSEYPVPGNLIFYTQNKTYKFFINELNIIQARQIQEYIKTIPSNRYGLIPYSLRKRFDLEIPITAFSQINKSQIRPDCDEIPTSYDELIKLSNSIKQGGMIEFLQNLPKGSLQIFTMMTKTQSLQHQGVNKNNPRIIRTNATGDITMTYVCDEKSAEYGVIEMMHFDYKKDRFKFTSLDFRNKKDDLIFTDDHAKYLHLVNTPHSYKNLRRVNKNPKTCLKCHSSTPDSLDPDPRPNWAEYRVWEGAFGKNDDRLILGSDETNDFLTLKEKMKGNPCFESLPWPKKEYYSEDNLFPYSTIVRSSNYDIRPNLRLTDIYPRLNAKRLARKFLSSPKYEKIKYISMMNLFQCEEIKDYDSQILSHGLDNYNKAYQTKNKTLYYSPETNETQRDYSLLFKIGKALGFVNSDWTLWFNRPDTNSYRAPIITRSEFSSNKFVSERVIDVVKSELLHRASLEHPELLEYRYLDTSINNFFLGQASCIQEIASPLNDFSDTTKSKICKNLFEIQKIHEEKPESIRIEKAEKHSIHQSIKKKNEKNRELYIQELFKNIERKNIKKYNRGKKVVQTCISCHSQKSKTLPKIYHFFENELKLRQELSKRSDFYNQTKDYINSGRMPKDSILSQKSRIDFLYYIKYLFYDVITKQKDKN